MANFIISGHLLFDLNRTGSPIGLNGIASVPVVLQDISSTKRITALTDVTGAYSFTNVPDLATYRIVEAYGQPGIASPTDFSAAQPGAVPVGVDPPISYAPTAPAIATNLDSVTPNTLIVTLNGANITNQNFLDGPVTYTPISQILDPCVTVSDTNLLQYGDNGTFGFFLAGTAANTGLPGDANNPPYVGVGEGFTYVQPSTTIHHIPVDGEYTIQNTMNNSTYNQSNEWWRVSDHTTGDETGAFMVVNGSFPGQEFFNETVAVSPNTYYLFSTWVMNLLKYNGTPPKLGVQILDQNGNVIYFQNLGNLLPNQLLVPAWQEIGTVINSQSNSSITVQFISQGPTTNNGNDFAIDDIMLQPIQVPVFTPVKSVDASPAEIGDTVTYTVTLMNTCTSPLTSVFFQDTLSPQLQYIAGSATGGSNPGTDDPNAGFSIPSISGGGTATITFQVKVLTAWPNNSVNNTATMNYKYTPVQGGIPNSFLQTSNLAPLAIIGAYLNIVKTENKQYANTGDTITYTLIATNIGSATANNVVFTDPIPAGTTYVSGSTTASVPFTGDPTTAITLNAPISAGASVTISYQVKIGSTVPLANPIPNTARSAITYTIDPSKPNGASRTNQSNTVTTLVSNAALTIKKVVDKTIAYVGDVITYQVALINIGNVPASSVILTDPVVNGTTYVAGSLAANVAFTGSPLTTIHLINPIAPGETVSLTYQVLVTKIPNQNPIPNTMKAAFTYTVNPLDPGGVIGTSVSNTVNTVVFRNNYDQEISDLIYSIALQEAAIANIANAEGAKIQKLLAMGATPNEVLCVNKSVADMLDVLNAFESVLKQKLSTVDCQINSSCMS